MDRMYKLILAFLIGVIANAQTSCQKRSNLSVSEVSLPLDTVREAVTGYTSNLGLTFGHNISYGNYKTPPGTDQVLKMDIYKPVTANPASKQKYPLYVWMFAGGFEVGQRANNISHIKGMAKKGYVTASFDYRIGWGITLGSTSTICATADSVLAANAIVRSIQDSRAALRYLVHNADLYNIDTSQIFVGGSSAGSCSWLINQYITEDIYYYFVPSSAFLGSWDSATNTLTDKYKIKGIVSLWGAGLDTSLITPGNAVPTLFVHGTMDGEVPYNVGSWYRCKKLPVGYGSLPTYTKLASLGVPAYAQIKIGGSHVVYKEDDWTRMADRFIKGVISKKYITGFYNDNAGPLIAP